MTARVALYRGEDSVGIRSAIRRQAAALGEDGQPLERWTIDGGEAGPGAEKAARLLDQITERVATAPLFGGGTLVVVRQPAGLMRDRASRERLLRLVAEVPPGNGLAFDESVELRRSKAGGGADGPLAGAVRAAGGEVHLFPAPRGNEMVRWLIERASELEIELDPAGARLLADRVGAEVREGDVDRRGQTELAWSELTKLAILRPDGRIGRDDVAELVPEATPASAWAFLDAIGQRRVADATAAAERLLSQGWAIQLLTSQLHRRLRELIVARDLADRRRPPAELVGMLKTTAGRAPILARQAALWAMPELSAALEGLLELDLTSKGLAADGSSVPSSDGRTALALQVWIAERVGRTGGMASRPPSSTERRSQGRTRGSVSA